MFLAELLNMTEGLMRSPDQASGLLLPKQGGNYS
jgi:hypothetical protein